VQSNQTHATYACRQPGAVFPDTRQRVRSLLCLDSVLLQPLPPLNCILMPSGEEEEVNVARPNLTTVLFSSSSGSEVKSPEDMDGKKSQGEETMTSVDTRLWVQEVLLPFVLLTFLLILSLAALILLSLARRQRLEMERLRERQVGNTLTVTTLDSYHQF
jgi:hypothetical protein